MRVLIFGDSITQGFYDHEGGWAQRLASEYHGKTLQSMLVGRDFECHIFNLGVSGDTSRAVLKRINNEIEVRERGEEQTVIVIAVGINDARHENKSVLMDVYEFQETYEKVVDVALKYSDHVLCIGLSAVDESQTNPWPYSSGKNSWGNNRINLFEDTIKQSAERKDVPFVPIHDQFLAQLEAGNELLADGLHPNEAGHQLILELVKPELEKLLRP